MKYIFYLLIIGLLFFQVRAAEIEVDIVAHEHSKMFLCLIVPQNALLQSLIQTIKNDLGFSNQFDVSSIERRPVQSKREIKELGIRYPIVIFLDSSGNNVLEYRMYDAQRVAMIGGKKIAQNGKTVRDWAHACAEHIWQALVGKKGSFSSKIAYCKEIRQPGKRAQKHVYLADYDGSHAHALVTTPTINIAPRWDQRAADKPRLYYSECTLRNVRLVGVNMQGVRRVISDFNGLNMLITFASDGKKAVLCLSRDGTTQLYLYQLGSRGLQQLTHEGSNFSPCFINQDEIIFCSDNNNASKPYICKMNVKTQQVENIISHYCSSPAYSFANGKIAYGKLINHELQIFTYDLKSKLEQQRTFDSGSKDECCWSPCGTYLAYTLEQGTNSRIVSLNLQTGQKRNLTPAGHRCTYPAWSAAF